MQLNEYQSSASNTAVYSGRNTLQGLVYTTLGLAGETGEVANKVKKIIRGDKDSSLNLETKKELIFEAGDILWYLSQLVTELGTTLDEVAKLNIEKLESRKERGVIKGSGDNR